MGYLNDSTQSHPFPGDCWQNKVIDNRNEWSSLTIMFTCK